MVVLKIYLYIILLNLICFLLSEFYIRYKLITLNFVITPLQALKNMHKVNTTISHKGLLKLILVPFMSAITLIPFFFFTDEDFLEYSKKEKR